MRTIQEIHKSVVDFGAQYRDNPMAISNADLVTRRKIAENSHNLLLEIEEWIQNSPDFIMHWNTCVEISKFLGVTVSLCGDDIMAEVAECSKNNKPFVA